MSILRGPAQLADLHTFMCPRQYPYTMASSEGPNLRVKITLGFQSLSSKESERRCLRKHVVHVPLSYDKTRHLMHTYMHACMLYARFLFVFLSICFNHIVFFCFPAQLLLVTLEEFLPSATFFLDKAVWS